MYRTTESRLGIVKLNKEYDYNLFTPKHLYEVQRGIESTYLDPQAHAVYVSTEKGEHWSHGTDFKTMMLMVKEGNFDKVSDYIQMLYNL